MAHLADKLADFFYEELPSAEMSEARRHLETCKECRFEVEQFERIHLTLRTVPELDPPRRVVFAGTAFLAFVVRMAFSSGCKCFCRFAGRHSDRFFTCRLQPDRQ